MWLNAGFSHLLVHTENIGSPHEQFSQANGFHLGMTSESGGGVKSRAACQCQRRATVGRISEGVMQGTREEMGLASDFGEAAGLSQQSGPEEIQQINKRNVWLKVGKINRAEHLQFTSGGGPWLLSCRRVTVKSLFLIWFHMLGAQTKPPYVQTGPTETESSQMDTVHSCCCSPIPIQL